MMSQIIWFISFYVGIRIMENFHRHRNGFIVPAIWRTNYRNKHSIYEIKTPIIQLIERGISMGRFVCVQNRHCWSLLAIFEPLKNYFITCQKNGLYWDRQFLRCDLPERSAWDLPRSGKRLLCLGLWCSGACNRGLYGSFTRSQPRERGVLPRCPLLITLLLWWYPVFLFKSLQLINNSVAQRFYSSSTELLGQLNG